MLFLWQMDRLWKREHLKKYFLPKIKEQRAFWGIMENKEEDRKNSFIYMDFKFGGGSLMQPSPCFWFKERKIHLLKGRLLAKTQGKGVQ